MAFAEKGQEFESREVNLLAGEQHDPEYVKLNPDHVVPTLLHAGEVIRESTLINDYVDDAFAGPALRSADPVLRYRAAAIIHHIDSKLHGKVTGVFTHGVLSRGMVLQRPPEAVEAYLQAIPDPDERALRTSLIRHGAQAPEMVPAAAAMVAFFTRMDAVLAGQPWLSGHDFGLADICALPYIVRFDEMGLAAFWDEGAAPGVADWLDRATARPSFDTAFSQWMPGAMASTFKALADEARPALTALIKAAQTS